MRVLLGAENTGAALVKERQKKILLEHKPPPSQTLATTV
jgi:hypothetical protein